VWRPPSFALNNCWPVVSRGFSRLRTRYDCRRRLNTIPLANSAAPSNAREAGSGTTAVAIRKLPFSIPQTLNALLPQVPPRGPTGIVKVPIVVGGLPFGSTLVCASASANSEPRANGFPPLSRSTPGRAEINLKSALVAPVVAREAASRAGTSRLRRALRASRRRARGRSRPQVRPVG